MKSFRIFCEKWIDTIKGRYAKQAYDVFENPSGKEIMEFPNQWGFRIILDLDAKKLYVTDGDILHQDMFDNIEALKNSGISYDDATRGRQSRFFLFGANGFNGRKFEGYYSDSLEVDVLRNDDMDEVERNLMEMRNKDWSFFERWIDTRQLVGPYLDNILRKIKE